MTVENALKLGPEAWTIFKTRGTDCIGCFMQRFCSLEEVAEAYRLPVERLMEELQQCVTESNSKQGVSYEQEHS